MADTKISALTAVSGAARSMLIPVVEDPSGTPVTKKMTVSQLLSLDSGSHSSSSPLLDMAQTWNAGGTTFTALKFNVAAVAAAADSKLIDLQVGGTTAFRVKANGVLAANGIESLSSNPTMSGGGNGWLLDSSLATQARTTGLYFAASSTLVWTDSSSYSGTADLILLRDAANTLAQRNGTTAQALRIYNSYTDASNYERLSIGWSGGNLFIATERAGTGSAKSIYFNTVATVRWAITDLGHLLAWGDNSYDIGSSGDKRPRNVYVAGLAVFGGTVTATSYVASSVYTITSKLRVSSPSDGLVLLQNAGASDFDRLQLGGTTSSFPAIKRDSAGLKFVVADDSASAAVEALSYKSATPSGGTAAAWKFGTLVTAAVTPDTTRYIELDVAGTLYKVIVST